MCVCIAVFEYILRVKSGGLSIWWVPLNILSLSYNKIYKTENTESSIKLNKIRSLLGGSSEHGFREHRPCYIHGRTHVGISDVAKCGKGILVHKPNKIILFTVTCPYTVFLLFLYLWNVLQESEWCPSEFFVKSRIGQIWESFCSVITRQQIELESCSNPAKRRQAFLYFLVV